MLITKTISLLHSIHKCCHMSRDKVVRQTFFLLLFSVVLCALESSPTRTILFERLASGAWLEDHLPSSTSMTPLTQGTVLEVLERENVLEVFSYQPSIVP